jgi:outer membrane protein OmpA-like peptidoglycan-associated protein
MIVFLIAAIAGVAIYNASLSSEVDQNARAQLPSDLRQVINPTQDGFKLMDFSHSTVKPTLKTWPNNVVKSEPINKMDFLSDKNTSISNNVNIEAHSISVYFDSESYSLDSHQEGLIRQFVNNSKKSVFFVTGFASPDGSPIFNKHIAKKRAESICKTLIHINSSLQCVVKNRDLTDGGGKRKAVISIE